MLSNPRILTTRALARPGAWALAAWLAALLLALGGLSPRPVGAQPAPTAQAAPATAAPGETFALSGAGWPAGATLSAIFYEAQAVGGPGASIGSAIQVGADGRFAATGTVPHTLFGSGSRGSLAVVPGPYTIVLRHPESGAMEQVAFTVGAPRDAALVWGQIIFDTNLNGMRDPRDVAASSLTGVWLDTPAGSGQPRAMADARGRYLLTSVAPGRHTVAAIGHSQDQEWVGTVEVEARLGEAARADLLLRPRTAEPPPVPHDARYFAETGYRVDDDAVWAYFGARGGLDVFGYPVSRPFTFLGCQVQVFQRQVAQRCGGGDVALLNLLDPDIFPYTRINGSTFPGSDDQLKNSTPSVNDPSYATAILAFVDANAPDVWQGVAVRFGRTFFGLITPAMAGTDDPGLLGLVNLEAWGAPISHPQADPANAQFVYQRFQRGVMHYDAATGATRGILLADYLKQILRAGPELPDDLRQQAAGSRYFAQYCPARPAALCRPAELPGTDLTFAFEPG